MIRVQFAALLAAAALSCGCAGTFSGSASASVDVSADIQVPIAEMPPKYAAWVVEAEGYLAAVNAAYAMHTRATADLAAVLGVDANADAIAAFLRNAIQIETTMTCTPPSFNASVVADCRAEASARARGNASGGSASGAASAGISANCEARGSLSIEPGQCTFETTVTEHPILGDAARWATVQANMKVILQLSAANVHLDGRGAGINARGMELYAQSVTDLADDPTLALQLNNIQGELKKGADLVGAANEKQLAMNSDLSAMVGVINDQFPQMRASVEVR